jgi:hypothetical protein
VAKTKRLGRLETVGDCISVLAKIARAAWAGSVPSHEAHRIASIVVMVRQSIEGAALEKLTERIDALEGHGGANGAVHTDETFRAPRNH